MRRKNGRGQPLAVLWDVKGAAFSPLSGVPFHFSLYVHGTFTTPTADAPACPPGLSPQSRVLCSGSI